MLVSELIDDTFNRWLYPSGVDRPAFDTLDGAIDDATTTITLGGRQSAVPRDTVLEIGSELILSKESSSPVVTAQERGYLGSTAASHSDGDTVLIDPKYTRVALLRALNDIISKLYPWGVYARKTDTSLTFDTSEVFSLPSGAKRMLSVLIRQSGSKELYKRFNVRGRDFLEYREFDPPKVQMLRGAFDGAETVVVYAADYAEITSEDTDLDDLVSPSLQYELPMAVAGTLLRGKEIPRVQIEEIRRMLAVQGIQVGAALNVGQTLIDSFRQVAVLAERRRLAELDEPTFEITRSR